MRRQRVELPHSYEPSSTDRHRQPPSTFPRERRGHFQAPSPTHTFDTTDEDERSVRVYEEAYSDEEQAYEEGSHYDPPEVCRLSGKIFGGGSGETIREG